MRKKISKLKRQLIMYGLILLCGGLVIMTIYKTAGTYPGALAQLSTTTPGIKNKPDLAIASTLVMPNNVNPNVKDIGVYFNRLNSGDFKQYRIKLYDQLTGWTDYRTVINEVQGNADFSLPAGTYDLIFTIDCDNVIDEANETNNTKLLSVTIALGQKAPQLSSAAINSSQILSAYGTTETEAACVLLYSTMENFSSSQKVVASIVQRAAPTNDGLFHYYARLAGAREEYYYKFQCVYSDQQILESSVFQVTNNKPDLLISAVSIKYRLNGYFITVTIKNRGYAMASTSDSFIKVKVTQTAGTSTVYEANEAMALKRGESRVISVGPINIKGLAYFEGVAYVDPDKTISELNESNNAYQKKLPIYRPDFALRDIIIAYEPQAAIDDEQIHTRYYTYVTFTNKGMGVNAATQDMTKDLFVMVYFTDEKGRKSAYGAPIWEYYFWNGYTRTIRIAAPMDTGESRIMKATAIIDTNNKYEENNENNNTLSKNLPVPKK